MRRLTFIFLFLFSSQIQSDGMPVYDFFNHVENVFTTIESKLITFNTRVNNVYAVRRIRNQLIQIEEAKKRFHQLRRQYEALTGKYGYGQWLKGPARLADPTYRPESRAELLRLLREGESTGPYADDRDAWINVYLPPDPKDGNIHGRDNAESHQRRALSDTALTLELESNYLLYEDSAKRLKAIDDIASKIDETENVKQAMDLLNANVLALHTTTEKLLTLQSRMAQRASVHDTGTMLENKRSQEFLEW